MIQISMNRKKIIVRLCTMFMIYGGQTILGPPLLPSPPASGVRHLATEQCEAMTSMTPEEEGAFEQERQRQRNGGVVSVDAWDCALVAVASTMQPATTQRPQRGGCSATDSMTPEENRALDKWRNQHPPHRTAVLSALPKEAVVAAASTMQPMCPRGALGVENSSTSPPWPIRIRGQEEQQSGLPKASAFAVCRARCTRICRRSPPTVCVGLTILIMSACFVGEMVYQANHKWRLTLDDNDALKHVNNCTFAECCNAELAHPARLRALPKGMAWQSRGVERDGTFVITNKRSSTSPRAHETVVCLFSTKCLKPTQQPLVPNQDSCKLSNTTENKHFWGDEGLGANGLVCQANVGASVTLLSHESFAKQTFV